MDKIIIADTSCLIVLSNIGLLTILNDLYHEILITPEVKDEFKDILPDWIIVSGQKLIRISFTCLKAFYPGRHQMYSDRGSTG